MTDVINVRDVLQDATTFGPDQVARIRTAIARKGLEEVRRHARELREHVENGDASEEVRRALGVISYLLADHATADECLSSLPGDGIAEFYHAKSLIALERYEEAADKFLQAERDGWDGVECTLLRAGVIRLMGRLEESEQLVRSTGTAGATRAEYSYQMGCIMADRCDSFGAFEYFERAADMDPRHAATLFRLAALNNMQGNEEVAVQLYERCLSTSPLFLGALINLGLLYEEIDNNVAAAFCFRRALEFDPNDERAQLHLKDIESAGESAFDAGAFSQQKGLDQLLQRPITDFELSARGRNCLERAGITTLGDLTGTTESALLEEKNFGETSLREVRQMLESIGLRIGQSVSFGTEMTPVYRQDNLSPEERKLLEMTVSDLQLSVRARKCLNRLGITVVGDLVSRTADQLLSVRNFGVTSLNEIRAKLTSVGTSLRNE